MKKYFAKYLPVEGNIEHGDFYISGKDGIIYKKHHLLKTDERDKKVKLFLCSRDIHAGDIVTDSIDGTSYEAKEGLLPSEMVKVIGEISSEATWVKEGDEFDKDEIFLSGIGNNWDENTPLSGKSIAFIKGSCGHFH